METTIGLAGNSEKNHQLNIIDNFLVSKYWGTKAVFHAIYFCTRRFFYWSFKTKAVSSNNIQTALRKTFMSKRGLYWWWCLFFALIWFVFVFFFDLYSLYSLYWFFFSEILKFCQLHVLNSFIQQRLILWCKANWMEKFFKFRPLAYLEPCETSMMELFCENWWLLLVVHYFHRNAQSSEWVSEIYLIFLW